MFERSIEDFKSLFVGDNIRELVSVKTLKDWGKTESLLQSLKVDPKLGIADDQATLSQRKARYGQNLPVLKPETTLWEMVNMF